MRWLVGIGAEDVLKNFEAEGFSTMAEVHRAGLSEEDLVVLGFEDEETRAKAVGSLAQMNAELGRPEPEPGSESEKTIQVTELTASDSDAGTGTVLPGEPAEP